MTTPAWLPSSLHACVHSLFLPPSLSLSLSLSHTHTHTNFNAHTLAHTLIHTQTHLYTHSLTYTLTHTPKQIRTNTGDDARMMLCDGAASVRLAAVKALGLFSPWHTHLHACTHAHVLFHVHNLYASRAFPFVFLSCFPRTPNKHKHIHTHRHTQALPRTHTHIRTYTHTFKQPLHTDSFWRRYTLNKHALLHPLSHKQWTTVWGRDRCKQEALSRPLSSRLWRVWRVGCKRMVMRVIAKQQAEEKGRHTAEERGRHTAADKCSRQADA